MHIVISGNIVDGIKIYGPFNAADEAIDWAADVCDDETWFVSSLKKPNRKGKPNASHHSA
jgi:hypothetical protein